MCLLVTVIGIMTMVEMGFAQQQRGPGQRMGRPGMAGETMSHLLQPDFHIRDLSILAQQLELDRSQRPIFEMLLEDYREAFRDAAADLEKALRHHQLRSIEQRLERDFSHRSPADAPIERDQQEVTLQTPERTITLQAERRTIDSSEADSDHPRSWESLGVMFAVSTTEQQEEDDGNRDRGGDSTDSASDAEGDGERSQRRRDLPDDVRERIERMRERIRERIERRIEQQREEMRQRGIDPDEEAEAIPVEEMTAVARSLLNDKRQLRSRVERDAAILLTPRQREALPQALRTIRRLNGLQNNRLSGEQIDLSRVLDELHLVRHPHQELELLLESYHHELDAAIQARKRFLEQADIDRFTARDARDWDTLLALADQESQRRVAVRTVNETYAERIADELPNEAHQERFITAVHERSFPQFAEPTQADRLFTMVLRYDGLEPEHREAVEDLRDRHTEAMTAHRRQAMDTVREHEVTRPREIIEFQKQIREWRDRLEAGLAVGPQRLRPPMAELRQVRRDTYSLDRRFARQLRSAVPSDVLEQIMKEDERVHALLERFERPLRRGGPRGGRRDSSGE